MCYFKNFYLKSMKRLLLSFLLPAIVSCGNGSSTKNAGVKSITVDTSFSGRVLIDSSSGNKMNADTTGMSEAK
jgi:hypothetical protein